MKFGEIGEIRESNSFTIVVFSYRLVCDAVSEVDLFDKTHRSLLVLPITPKVRKGESNLYVKHSTENYLEVCSYLICFGFGSFCST